MYLHVRVLNNPNDTVAWQRVLMLIEGVGPKSAEDLFLWIQQVQSKKESKASADSTNWFSNSEWLNKSYYNGLNKLGKCLVESSKRNIWYDCLPLIIDYYLPICTVYMMTLRKGGRPSCTTSNCKELS